MNESGEHSDPARGGTPELLEPVRRRRIRKLSGPARDAMGELAFCMYRALTSEVPVATRLELLSTALLGWRARYL